MLLFPLLTSADRNTISQSPSGLMVEFIREPEHVMIMDPRPEFTWIVPDAAGMQTAYQILVSSSEERLKKDEADCWNSNKTFGSRSAEVEYAGAGLNENRVYYWKVRIWDKKERTSAFRSEEHTYELQ